MGVDFDNCDTCGETTCTDNFVYMDLPFGRFTTCKVCCKKYFTKEIPEEVQKDILDEHDHGYIFYAAPRSDKEPTKNDVIFMTGSIPDMEEFSVGKDLDFGSIQIKEKDTRDDWYFYDDTFDVVWVEVFDTFVYEQKKIGNDLTREYGEWIPDHHWKQLMQKRLDKQIETLQIKRTKFN